MRGLPRRFCGRRTRGAIELLADDHMTEAFQCGEPSLDDWLKRRARASQGAGASRTYVACESKVVVGYYALASGAVAPAAVPGRFRRNMPDPKIGRASCRGRV